jgi:hypothetical protein
MLTRLDHQQRKTPDTIRCLVAHDDELELPFVAGLSWRRESVSVYCGENITAGPGLDSCMI